MGIQGRRFRRSRIAVAGTVVALATAGSAFALQGLPPGAQVNNDPAAGINPALSVSGEDPANADVVGGALTAGKPAVPWAVFRQQDGERRTTRSSRARLPAARGRRAASGRSAGARAPRPTFPGSLNFDQGQDGEAPAIDFAGAGRTVPWATWYENTTGTGVQRNNIFASRFDNTGDANQGKWIFAGQGRGNGGGGTVPVPSLNIHTDQDAENPSVAGGSRRRPDQARPVGHLAGDVHAGFDKDQIFVRSRSGPGMANCDGVTPAGVADGTGHVPAVGGFCFQQTGIQRVGTGDARSQPERRPARATASSPTSRSPAPNDTRAVGRLVRDGARDAGLQCRQRAWCSPPRASATAPACQRRLPLGRRSATAARAISTPRHQRLRHVRRIARREQACSLNIDPTADAEDPRVASGTMNPANPTVPWVAWDEDAGTHHQVFVSRLVGTGTAARFVPVNDGKPISTGEQRVHPPDITFSGNTPVRDVARRRRGGATTAFAGHFVERGQPDVRARQQQHPGDAAGSGRRA